MHLGAVLTVGAGLILTWSAPVRAFWKVSCSAPLIHERADPVVNPGTVSGHVHTIMGGNGFGFSMDFEQARASTCTTCRVAEDKSNYWVPSLYYRAQNGSYIAVEQVGGALIYYLHRMEAGQDESSIVAFPEGFRMLAGDAMLREYTDTVEAQAVSFACLGQSKAETPHLPNYNCPNGLRAQVFFPSCWNGVDLDSPDHKSHIVYPTTTQGGTCPEGFKHRTMSLFYEVLWAVDAFKDMWYGDEQPFVFSNGDPTGYGYHADFVNGWHVETLQKAIHTCLDGNRGGGNNGDINLCPPLLPLLPETDCQGCKIPPSIDEQVHGVLDALPGCNPVQSGPGRATPQSDCGAPTSYGSPDTFYTDLTSSNGWEYVGCGTDIAFQARTLPDAATAGDDMTVEKCVNFCGGKGFSYAGLEYARECFCGNSIPEDRAPKPGIVGNCMMKCAGDDREYCGGAQLISLYRKCGGSCQNSQTGVVGNSTQPRQNLTTNGGSAPEEYYEHVARHRRRSFH